VFRNPLALHVYVRELSCCPAGVNCFLGDVLSFPFVEKKFVLLFSDFFRTKSYRKRTDGIRGERVEGTKEGREEDKEEGKELRREKKIFS